MLDIQRGVEGLKAMIEVERGILLRMWDGCMGIKKKKSSFKHQLCSEKPVTN